MKKEITILHCSDLHCGFEEFDGVSQEEIRQRNEKLYGFLNIIKSPPEGWAPEILAISGDIGWSGAENDYDIFKKSFLTPVLSITGISPENVLICAGNHDKNDISSKNLNRPDCTNHTCPELSPDNLDDWLAHAFSAFLDSCHDNGIAELDNLIKCESANNFRAKYAYGHKRIGFIDFLVMNSAWDCYHDRGHNQSDKGLIRIGRQFVSDAINRIPNKDGIVITMLHHPFSWLHPLEADVVRAIKTQSHIVLCGHEHSPGKDDDNGCVVLHCSTISSNDTSDFGFELIKITLSDIGLPSILATKYGCKSNVCDSEWVWQDGGRPNVLGDRAEIAASIIELSNSISKNQNNMQTPFENEYVEYNADNQNEILIALQELISLPPDLIRDATTFNALLTLIREIIVLLRTYSLSDISHNIDDYWKTFFPENLHKLVKQKNRHQSERTTN